MEHILCFACILGFFIWVTLNFSCILLSTPEQLLSQSWPFLGDPQGLLHVVRWWTQSSASRSRTLTAGSPQWSTSQTSKPSLERSHLLPKWLSLMVSGRQLKEAYLRGVMVLTNQGKLFPFSSTRKFVGKWHFGQEFGKFWISWSCSTDNIKRWFATRRNGILSKQWPIKRKINLKNTWNYFRVWLRSLCCLLHAAGVDVFKIASAQFVFSIIHEQKWYLSFGKVWTFWRNSGWTVYLW